MKFTVLHVLAVIVLVCVWFCAWPLYLKGKDKTEAHKRE